MGKRKNLPPSKASIRDALLEGLFDPRDRTPMSIVVGLQDPSYCESKALELISEAKIVAGRGLWDQYQEKVAQALSLLALCKVQRSSTGADRGTSQDSKAQGP